MEHILLEAFRLFGRSVNIEYVKKIMLNSSESHVDIDVEKLVEDINKLFKKCKEIRDEENNIPIKSYKKITINGETHNIPVYDPKDIPDSWLESDSDQENLLM